MTASFDRFIGTLLEKGAESIDIRVDYLSQERSLSNTRNYSIFFEADSSLGRCSLSGSIMDSPSLSHVNLGKLMCRKESLEKAIEAALKIEENGMKATLYIKTQEGYEEKTKYEVSSSIEDYSESINKIEEKQRCINDILKDSLS